MEVFGIDIAGMGKLSAPRAGMIETSRVKTSAVSPHAETDLFMIFLLGQGSTDEHVFRNKHAGEAERPCSLTREFQTGCEIRRVIRFAATNKRALVFLQV
jgi:hypothetical protein